VKNGSAVLVGIAEERRHFKISRNRLEGNVAIGLKGTVCEDVNRIQLLPKDSALWSCSNLLLEVIL
jgi:hypothetical protein